MLRRFVLLVLVSLTVGGCTTNAGKEPTPTIIQTDAPESGLQAWLDEELLENGIGDGQPIEVHFSEPMKSTTLQPLIISPYVEGKFEWNHDHTVLSYIPIRNYAKVSEYTIEVRSYLTSKRGERLKNPPTWTVKVSEDYLLMPNRNPSGATLSPKNPSFSLNFHPEMDKDSVEQGLRVNPKVPLEFEWTGNNLKITILGKILPNQPFFFTLDEPAQSVDGTQLIVSRWSYTLDPIKVKIRENSRKGLGAVEMEFNYPMNRQSVEERIQLLPNLETTFSWDDDNKMITITPMADAPPWGREIEISLERGAKDISGKQLIDEHQYNYKFPEFKVKFEITKNRPQTIWAQFEFTVPIDTESFRKAIQITPAFEYSLLWNSKNTVVTIHSRGNVKAATNFTIFFVGDVMGKHGEILGDMGTYTLKSIPPILELKSTWREEYNNYISIYPEKDLKLTFDREVDPESVEAALTIDPPIGVTFAWENEKTLLISPQAGKFEEMTTYILTLEKTAKNADGSRIFEKAFSWDVDTRPYGDELSFGIYGASAQVVDLDGERLIQVSGPTWYDNDDHEAVIIQVELYQITVQQYIDFMKFREENSYDSWGRRYPIYPIQGSGKVAEWEVRRSDPDIVLPEDLAEGIYIMNLVTDHINDQLVIVATTTGLTIKVSEEKPGLGEILVWVSDINGYVMPKTRVWVYDKDGVVIAWGETDESGVFEGDYDTGSSPYAVLAKRGESTTLSGVDGWWRTRSGSSVRSFWRSFFSTPISNEYLAYIYTERPIYRPGQVVNYKGILREERDVVYTMPDSDLEIVVNLRDARNNLVASQSTTLSAFGTFHGSFQLSSGATLGEYSIEININGELHAQIFKVEEYKKPDIQVEITADRKKYVQGEDVNVTVNANYLFGEPVRTGILKIELFELAPSSYGYRGNNEPSIFTAESFSWYKLKTLATNKKTDVNGQAELSFKAAMGSYYDNYYNSPDITYLGVEVTIDDGSDQYVSAFTIIEIYPAAAELSLDIGDWVQLPNEPIPITAAITSEFGDQLSSKKLTLKVEQRVYEPYYSGYGWYRSLEELDSVALETDENGFAQTEIAFEKGVYRLTLEGKDSHGNPLEVTRWMYVYDASDLFWDDIFDTEIVMHTIKDEYEVGETAEIMVETGFSGEALLTIERGSVLEYRIVKLTAPFTRIKVPIREGFAPNVFVTVQMWEDQDVLAITSREEDYNYRYSVSDSKLRMDSVSLKVKDNSHELQIELSSDRESYQAGEEATFEVRVVDQHGRPVEAEVSLALVDEAIFLLSEELSLPIHDAFYQPRTNSVKTYDSYSPSRTIRPCECGGGGGGGGWGSGDFGAPRSDFPDTVVWYPNIVTDADGRATITVKLPDTLTTWRMTAKAVTKDTKVGEGDLKIITTRAVIVRPQTPRSLVAGDEFVLSAIVHNFTDEAMEFTVSASTNKTLVIGRDRTQTFRIGANEQVVVVWPATAQGEGTAKVTVRARAGDVGDAIQVEFPVQAFRVETSNSQSDEFSGTKRVMVSVPASALPESVVRVEVNRTIAESLLNGVDYLTGFPYGCVEQTMSRAFPNAVVARAYRQLGLEDRLGMAELDPKIRASIQRLYGFQHEDGGWGWWFDDASDAYQTAWVIYGLAVMQEAGYEISDQVIENGVEYLALKFNGMNLPTRAFALYAMNMENKGSLEKTLLVYEMRAALDNFSQAALALTLYDLGETAKAKEISENLMDKIVSGPNETMHIPDQGREGYYNRKFMSSEVRANALVLKALLTIQPGSEYQDGLAKWLMTKRNSFGWGTTNETAFTLLALSDYILVEKTGNEAIEFSVKVNGTEISSHVLEVGEDSWTLDLPVKMFEGGENQIDLVTSDGSKLYYTVTEQIYSRNELTVPAGVSVSREYLDPNTKKKIESIQEGDLVLVRLKVYIPQKQFYLMIEDALPGGLEALNQGLTLTSHDTQALEGRDRLSRYRWVDKGYNYKEIRPGRVIFFITELSAGNHVFEYYARAIVSGKFRVMPVMITAMYDVAFWGRSASDEFVIEAR
ncbi:MAG: MG2 domain-containing protein [Anaerolineae bacterium]|nr:MG2 domain-containing protein [Anaerolineae bacterium]